MRPGALLLVVLVAVVALAWARRRAAALAPAGASGGGGGGLFGGFPPVPAHDVNTKEGVELELAPLMWEALPAIERAHENAGIARGALVTSGTDGAHMVGSLHYRGLALDLRTRDLGAAQTRQLAGELRAELGSNFEVLIESDHIHVEYDPVK